MFRRNSPLLLITIALTVSAVQPVGAQGWMDRVKNAAKEAAARKAEQGATDGTNGTIDAATGKMKCVANDSKCAAKAHAAGKGTITVDASGNPVANAAGATGTATSNVGADFTPGTRVIFADNFSSDEIGNFPRAFTLKSGNMEVADVGGTRFLRSTSYGEFDITLPEVLPDRFTIEFDASLPTAWRQQIIFTDNDNINHIEIGRGGGGFWGPDNYAVESSVASDPGNAVFPVKIMGDGQYVKVYMNGTRVANAPNAALGRSRRIRFLTHAGNGDDRALFGNFRIAAGGKDLYSALNESGHVATEGVYFATGSDKLTPESAPALKQIGDMLAAHPDLRLSIEGHTDNVGAAAANQTLSSARAASVRNYLVSTFGIDTSRLSSQGYGSTRPVSDNTTEAGRQKNRRVELVKKN